MLYARFGHVFYRRVHGRDPGMYYGSRGFRLNDESLHRNISQVFLHAYSQVSPETVTVLLNYIMFIARELCTIVIFVFQTHILRTVK